MVWRPACLVLSFLCLGFLTPNLCRADLVIATMRGTLESGTLTKAGGGTYDLAGRSFEVRSRISDATDWWVSPGPNPETTGMFAASSTTIDFGEGLTTEFGDQEIGIYLYSASTDTENVFQYEFGFIMNPTTAVNEYESNWAFFAYGGFESQLLNGNILQELNYDELVNRNQGTMVNGFSSFPFTTQTALGDEVSFALSRNGAELGSPIPNASFSIRAVPEPSSVAALAVASLAIGFVGWRRYAGREKLQS